MRVGAVVGSIVLGVIAGCGGSVLDTGVTCVENCPDLCLPGSDPAECDSSNVFVETIRQGSIDKIDVLFMIDNSISMADKQKILAEAIPDLVNRLVNPVCVSPRTGEVREAPDDINAACEDGFVREFAPIRDLHIGVVSSSLGTPGTDGCVPEPMLGDPLRDEMQDDHGRMIGARPRAFTAGLELASDVDGTPGFLVWQVTGGASQDLGQLNRNLVSLVRVTGERGCGYEASLEAWYRFLADPAPPADYEVVTCPSVGGDCIEPRGIDEQLLAQRRAFLRSDSLLTIVMLSDENDCSIQRIWQHFQAAQAISLPAASQACATNPNDPCCYPCDISPPVGCPQDPTCRDTATGFRYVPAQEDKLNLRCWQQKRRFGQEFLYPIARYVHALTEPLICPSRPDLSASDCSEAPVHNPIFSDLSRAGTPVRTSDLVLLAGIVGVPWQDIAADVDEAGNPLPARDPDGDGVVDELTFLTASQMTAQGVWGDILGSPEQSPPVLPRDPLMHESILQRTGTNPATGAALEGSAAGYYANPINGHEWNVFNGDALQYACIFPLSEPKDCPTEEASGNGCDCSGLTAVQAEQNPVCQNPDGSYGEVQYAAKAVPGLRFLHLLRDFGDGSIVTSICPSNTAAPFVPSYGYRAAIKAIIDRMKQSLVPSCLPRELPVAGEPAVPACQVLEVIPVPDAGCSRLGRAALAGDTLDALADTLRETGLCGGAGYPECSPSAWTICRVEPSVRDDNGDGIADCQQDALPPADVGWCYVDPARGLGDAALVEGCPPTQKRLLRFVDRDSDTPTKGATVLLACDDAPNAP